MAGSVKGSLKVLDGDAWVRAVRAQKRKIEDQCLGLYSNLWGGLLVDPRLMFVPIDDHGFHRGDGVFEAFKAVGGRIYLLREHLARLGRSAQALSISLPYSLNQIEELVCASAQQLGERDYIFRLYVTRGPGGFSVNPYETEGSALYLMVGRLIPPKSELYRDGAKLVVSQVPQKEGVFPTIKSLNYLPNVMMKKEAIDAGADFAVNRATDGTIGEGATENLMIVDENGVLRRPPLDKILAGTTMLRCMELAQALVDRGELRGVQESPIKEAELRRAREILMVGTTIDVMPVSFLDGHKVGVGKPGPVGRALLKLIVEDMAQGPRSVIFSS